ncbi:MAG: bacillithiol biosynthesis cysteine-adding enzyme BshC [Candidatus Kapabacteria bacterium]|nr:bacillithiol biosynthesis cysteine-adding enzyme BshC [Candidatus Kapabacteria bacterium]
MNTIEFSELHQTRLFIDFVRSEHRITSFFQESAGTFPAPDRGAVANAIRESMSGCDLTPAQIQALEGFENGARRIVTGQQVGLFGGALYSSYKASTAIQLANTSAEKAVAIFWVEDNDHDAAESAIAYHPGKELGTLECTLSVDAISKVPVGELRCTEADEARVSEFAALIGDSPFQSDVERILHRYKAGASWSDAFIGVLNDMFGQSGMLFIRASIARMMGLFAPVVLHELSNSGMLEQTVLQTSAKLQAAGYHVQAKPSNVNLFLHTDGIRHKVNNIPGDAHHFHVGSVLYSRDELMKKVRTSPSSFSPSVLLRPLVQDQLLGTDVYVAGPGEIAYLAQLQEYYAVAGIKTPKIAIRHSVTVLPKKVQRFLEKQSLDIRSLLKPYQEIEHELTTALKSHPVFDGIGEAQKGINTIFTTLRGLVKSVDATLDATVIGAEKNSLKEIDTIAKKTTAAIKRKEEQLFSKLRDVYSIIYPDAALQERRLTPIFLIGELGLDGAKTLLATIRSEPSDKHLLVPVLQETLHP